MTTDPDDRDLVAARIVQRYSAPSRVAHLYLFRVVSDGALDQLVPPIEAVVAAWVDEGERLAPLDPAEAVQRSQAVADAQLKLTRPQSPHERRRQMARCVQFHLTQPDANTIHVRLLSRALAFSPKGDREANELWRLTAEGWYSAYQPHPE